MSQFGDLSGSVVGGYLVLDEVGRGGMGTVYRARQQLADRHVAIKILNVDAAEQPENVERFRREYVRLSRLNHPNIARIHDVGMHQGRPYYVMDYCKGPTLRELMAGEADANRLVRILVKVCEALGAVHEAGLVHRDVKPTNVLIGADGEPLLVDFGLVTRSAGVATSHGFEPVTEDGTVLGSPYYMAPEQILGDRDRIGPPTDVHAVGVILYQILYGRVPFGGMTYVEVANRILEKRPRLGSPAPLALRTVCARCLEKDPDRRYPDGALLAAVLRSATAYEERVSSDVLQAVRRGSRRKAAIVALAAIGAVAGALALAWPVADDDRGEAGARSEPSPHAPSAGRMARPTLDRPRRTSMATGPRRTRKARRTRKTTARRLPARVVWKEDGAPMVLVSGGDFRMGSTVDEWRRWQEEAGVTNRSLAAFYNEFPPRRVHVGPFYVDVHPVTWGRYRVFAAAATGRGHPTPWCHPRCPQRHHDLSRPERERAESRRLQVLPSAWRNRNLPVAGVTWWDAYAYARWAGKRLPTEEEWEKSARWDPRTGRSRRFPWGDEWASDRCNTSESWNASSNLGWTGTFAFWRKEQRPGSCYLSPVGSYPAGASPVGAQEMAGGVWEWTATRQGAEILVKGGCWFLPRAFARGAYRFALSPDWCSYLWMGFRCAVGAP